MLNKILKIVVLRGPDNKAFGPIYEQMGSGINEFLNDENQCGQCRIDVVVEKCNADNKWKKIPLEGVDFVLALGDNVISKIDEDFLDRLNLIPLVTSIGVHRPRMLRSNTFHLWPFMARQLAYFAALRIAQKIENNSCGGLCGSRVFLITDKKNAACVDVFVETLKSFKVVAKLIDETQVANERNVDRLLNSHYSGLTYAYLTGIGDAHNKALINALRLVDANKKINLLVDQSFCDTKRNVSENSSKQVEYFGIASTTGIDSSRFFAFFVRETLHLLFSVFNEVCGEINDSGMSAADWHKKISGRLKTIKCHQTSGGAFFISDIGRLYTNLAFCRYSPLVQSTDEYAIIRTADTHNNSSAVAYLLQKIDALQLKLLDLEFDKYLPQSDLLASVFSEISYLILKTFSAKTFSLYGMAFDFETGKKIIFHGLSPIVRRPLCQTRKCSNLNNAIDYVIEFLAGSRTLESPIQIDLKIEDSEKELSDNAPDNDTLRLYFDSNNKGAYLPLAHYLKRLDAKQTQNQTKEIVLAKDQEQIGLKGVHIALDGKFINALSLIAIQYRIRCLYIIPEVNRHPKRSEEEQIRPQNLMVLSLGGEDAFIGERQKTFRSRLSYLDLRILVNTCTRIFSPLYTAESKKIVNVSNIKSAIGAIMSRNGSHNIGSHVLAALSHNVGTMPDDRVLYQYIQHRMDYIATATTEHPKWRQPTMFVACLMKEFLKQKHLLDHISGSEGLHAYKFQGQTICSVQPNTIRFHIRRIPDCQDAWETKSFLGDEQVVDFINYDKGEISQLSRDISVAIPGGVIGHHAFYTIIENVLRNAAKHEWAESLRIWKVAQAILGDDECAREYAECLPKKLDLYVDFRDNRKLGKIECRIWNDRAVTVTNTAKIRAAILGELRKKVKSLDAREQLLSVARILLHWYRLLLRQAVSLKDNSLFCLIDQIVQAQCDRPQFDEDAACKCIVDGLAAASGIDSKRKACIRDAEILKFIHMAISREDCELENKLRDKIRLSFIDENGFLRKENWGIAEMRISAGFLECCEMEQIGGLSGADDPLKIIWPVLVNNQNRDKCVAYRFNIDKPKLLLVVLSSKCNDLKLINDRVAQYGVNFITYSEMAHGETYPYSYVLFEHLDEDGIEQLRSRKIMLPFRNLCASAPKDKAFGEFVPKFSGSFFASNRLRHNLTVLSKNDDSAAKICYELLESVYADWLRHVQQRGLPRKDRAPRLVIDIDGGDSSGSAAQTLISRHELLKFIFENSFNAAIRSFLKENGPAAGTGTMSIKNANGRSENEIVSLAPNIAALLCAVSQMIEREIAETKDLADYLEISERDLLNSPAKIVSAQLGKWFDKVLGSADNVSFSIREVVPCWVSEFGSGKRVHVGTLTSLYNDPESKYWLDRFVNYVSTVILDQADSFLRKYEERFATLPKTALDHKSLKKCETKNEDDFIWSWKIGRDFSQDVEITRNAKCRARARTAKDICYFRHGTDIQPQIIDNYYEPLSGAQSTFNSFESLRRDLEKIQEKDTHCRVSGFVTQLIENASSRILIIDERVMKFKREHPEVSNILGGLRIAVADDNDAGVLQLFSAFTRQTTPTFSGIKLTDFEIVVIHQGIIDKLLPGHEQKTVVSRWMDDLINKLHYVVITTGRGSPANIPDTARVLPYSVIENSILQRFPEKMILVDAIMNILPVRHQKGLSK